jgi:hypothetical protein
MAAQWPDQEQPIGNLHHAEVARHIGPTLTEITGHPHRIFGEHSIPNRAFGGTALSGLKGGTDVYESIWMNKAGS